MFYFDVRLNIININSECTGNSKWMPGGFWHLVCCKAYRGLCQEQSTAIFHLPWEKNERKSLTWNENTNLQSCRQSLCPRMPNAFKYKSSSLADGKRQEVNQLFRVSPGPNTGAGGGGLWSFSWNHFSPTTKVLPWVMQCFKPRSV